MSCSIFYLSAGYKMAHFKWIHAQWHISNEYMHNGTFQNEYMHNGTFQMNTWLVVYVQKWTIHCSGRRSNLVTKSYNKCFGVECERKQNTTLVFLLSNYLQVVISFFDWPDMYYFWRFRYITCWLGYRIWFSCQYIFHKGIIS